MVFAWVETTERGIYYKRLNYLYNYVIRNKLFHKGTQRRLKVRKEKVFVINHSELEYLNPQF